MGHWVWSLGFMICSPSCSLDASSKQSQGLFSASHFCYYVSVLSPAGGTMSPWLRDWAIPSSVAFIFPHSSEKGASSEVSGRPLYVVFQVGCSRQLVKKFSPIMKNNHEFYTGGFLFQNLYRCAQNAFLFRQCAIHPTRFCLPSSWLLFTCLTSFCTQSVSTLDRTGSAQVFPVTHLEVIKWLVLPAVRLISNEFRVTFALHVKYTKRATGYVTFIFWFLKRVPRTHRYLHSATPKAPAKSIKSEIEGVRSSKCFDVSCIPKTSH